MNENVQERNGQMISVQTTDFTTRKEFIQSPAHLVAAVESQHRAYDGTSGGGGPLMYGWMADREAISSYIGSQTLTTANIAFSDFGSDVNGGPYVDLDGATEHLRIADAAWQEPLAEEFFVWHWANPAAIGSIMTVASKWDINGNNVSWRLTLNAAGNFVWTVSATGVPPGTSITTTKTSVVDTWYFVAGYFYPNVIMRLFVGEAIDSGLTRTTSVGAIPASLFNGNAPLAIGTSFNNAPTMLESWDGLIGIGGARMNTPPGPAVNYEYVNGFAARLFHKTRWFYT